MARFSVAIFLTLSALNSWRTAAGASLSASRAIPFDPGFDIFQVAQLAEALPSHSWEYGTASEALLELHERDVSVFGDYPFPPPVLSADDSRSLAYASTKFNLSTGSNTLIYGDGAVGDPASLGISAYLLGMTNATLAAAAKRELDYVLNHAPRFWNGAISQRYNYPELWADFMYMAPPFIAYYGAATDNFDILQQAVDQCRLQRAILLANDTYVSGAWTHILGPASTDPGVWSTGNGWAAAGMTRVLATVLKAPVAKANRRWRDDAAQELSYYIQEILDAAMNSDLDDFLLRNYWNDYLNSDGHGYGETSGTSLLAAVAYRMAAMPEWVLPEWKALDYASWGDWVRRTLGGTDESGNPHVTSNGTVTPSVNPLNWGDKTPYTAGSPEGQNFVVLMYAAWRDCVYADVCER
ncbi:hypothetical protein APHAL10511_003292 [Amanita phalloides]|nr:hypothetical protein APHAL10511_003292 [Amanita phalloides]